MGYIISCLIAAIVITIVLIILNIKKIQILIGIPLLSFILPLSIIGGGIFSETYDTEVWSGKVLSKEKEKVSCEHSYPCNCRQVCSGSGNSQSCTSTCDICYDHSYDFNWNVTSSIGTFKINRIDNQGVIEPSRWSIVKNGDPVSDTHRFTNYIKAARNNVLNRQGTKITYTIPMYPITIYDYYNIDRAISIDNAVPNLKRWSIEISKILSELGTVKQVNLVMVFTKNPQDFSEQLNASWLGGKKNDVIIVIGTNDGLTADWVNVLSWSKREDFKVQLRDAIMGVELNPEKQLQVIATAINTNFERRKMEEFEYLIYDIEPSIGYIWGAFISFFTPSLLLLIYIWKEQKIYSRNTRISYLRNKFPRWYN